MWDSSEYEKLPTYDGPTWAQPVGVFLCHQQDGRVCAGWAAVHDMDEAMSIRLAAAAGLIDPDDLEAIRDYTTDVPLFESGAEAARHGLALVDVPPAEAARMIEKLRKRRS